MKTRNPLPSTIIRLATVEDIPTIIQLNHDGILSWGKEFQPVLQEWIDSVCNQRYFSELISNPEKTLLVAECGGRILGTAYGYPKEGRLHTGGMYLSVRGQGIATLLMNGLITHARKLGLNEMSSTIHEHNYGALRFVSRMGWVQKDAEKFDGINYYNRVLVLS